jgi:flavin reductase (DIM6/NTAB) family NADH-FMN oxidoreductase RutF
MGRSPIAACSASVFARFAFVPSTDSRSLQSDDATRVPRNTASAGSVVPISTDGPIWDRFFTVAPIVLVATTEPDGGYDIAPKHMATPLGWDNYFGFVCHPRHSTHRNIERSGEFTVSFPSPEQVVETSLAATARTEDGAKPSLAALATVPASVVHGVLVAGAYLHLECQRDRIVAGIGEASLIVGRIVAAAVDERMLRASEVDDSDLIHRFPLLAYLSPGRFAVVDASLSFPFPSQLER